MKYTVNLAVRYDAVIEVEADDFDEAREEAESRFEITPDMITLYTVYAYDVTDENGNTVMY